MKKLLTLFTLAIASTVSYSQNLQGDLENWRTYTSGTTTLEAPHGWYGIDSAVYFLHSQFPVFTPARLLFKEVNTVHGGSAAAKIISRDFGPLVGVIPGLLVNADPVVDMSNFDPQDPMASLSYNGGTAVSQRIHAVEAWLKYLPNGVDTAAFQVLAVMNNASTGNNDSVVGYGSTYITGTMNSYSLANVSITYNNSTDIPTKIIILFISSATSGGKNGSTLYVDDVNFSTVSVNDIDITSSVSIYPNPATDKIYFQPKQGGNFLWEAYNLQGQKVAATSFIEKATADISNLPNGVYTYRIFNNEGTTIQRGKFNVVR